MEQPRKLRILIRTGCRASARRWTEMLRGDEAHVWLDPTDIPDDGQPDVIITDLGPHRDPGTAESPTESPPTAKGAPTTVGIVRIGPLETPAASPLVGDPAEVWLPEDVTARELRLACQLLTRIVRLHHQRQSDAELRHRLAEDALTDRLTGLPNRRAWDRAVEQRLAAAADRQRPTARRPTVRRLCVAIFDLDHFKPVNDTHGHAVGDQVLQSAGRAIRENLREDDFVARLGGDEFGLLLWVPDEPTAAAVVDRVRAALPSHLARDGTHVVTASAGYQLFPARESGAPPPLPESLYVAADTALRQAKQQGRDRTVGR